MKNVVNILLSVGKFMLLLATFLTASYPVRAAEQADPERLIATLSERLAKADNAADSIQFIYDIHDLTHTADRMPLVKQLYELAGRTGNHTVQLDMLRQWAILGAMASNDSIVSEALSLVDTLPDSEDRRQTRTFILASKASAHRYKSDAERSTHLRQLLKVFVDLPDDADPYERAATLFTLTEILSKETQGELLSEYLDYLDKAITAMPTLPNNYLRIKFNVIAAPSYSHNDETTKSIKADRSQLLTINQMLKFNRADGRFYKNFDIARYKCLRRLLLNYECLSDSDIHDYYAQVVEIAGRNPDVAADCQSDPSICLGMLVRRGKYDEALNAAKRIAADASGLYDRRRALRQLIDVADMAGDSLVRRQAENRNYYLMEEYMTHKANERVRELQILYDVNALRRQSAATRLRNTRNTLLALTVITVMLALLLGAVCFRLISRNRLIKRLKAENADLQSQAGEIERLRAEVDSLTEKCRTCESDKVQLISYISHELATPINAIIDYTQMIVENAREETKGFMHHFASVVDVNARILQEVANDVQEFSMIDTHRVPTRRIPVDANILTEIPCDSIKPQLPQGVSVRFTPSTGPDNTIITDPRRVQIILLSTLAHLIRITDSGTIDITLDIDRKKQTCSFIITESGKHLPDEEINEVMNNWNRFDPDARIEGLGLPNCKMMLDALNGTLIHDTDFTDGLRLVLTIPIN